MYLKKTKFHTLLLACAAVLVSAAITGCSPRQARTGLTFGPNGAFPTAPVVPPPGILYSSYSAPLMTDFKATPVSTRPAAELETWRIYIPLFGGPSAAAGDVSFQSLAEEAGLSTIYYADYEITNYVTIVSFTKFRLYGE